MTIRSAKEMEDRHWLEQCFFLRYNKIKERNENALRRSNLNLAFHDTTLGGNLSINPKYQFTRTCDPKAPTLSAASKGQGYYYNEAFDENAQRIWLQFGVMEFNSVGTFLAGSYNYKQAYLANKGKAESILFTVGQTLGFLSTIPVQVYFGLNWIYRRASAVLTGKPYSRFGYLKPTMSLYWTAATTLLNKIAGNMGIVPGLDQEDAKEYSENNVSYGGVRSKVGNLDDIVNSLPDTFKRTKNRLYIDLMAVSSRGQRLANQYYSKINDIRDNATSSLDHAQKIQAFMNTRFTETANKRKWTTQDDYLDAYLGSYGGATNVEVKPKKDKVAEIKTNLAVDPQVTIQDREPGFFDHLKSELSDGSAFVSFVVENQGPITDTFSNTTKAPGIEEMVNGVSERARDLYVNFGGGQLGDSIVADGIEAVIGGVSALIAGGLDAIGLGGLAALGGSGFTEFNEVYDNSDAQMDGGSFTIRLSTPYGNKISILQDIMAPLSMILAGVLPKATGKSSYTSPFCCRLYSPGRADYKLAMIKGATITRATDNRGWSAIAHLPTAIDITLEVESLNNVVSMPIATNILDDALSFSFFDEDTPMSDYLSSLSGLSLYEQFYISGKVNLAWEQTKLAFDQMTNASTIAQWAGYSTGGEIIKIFSPPGRLDLGTR